MRGWNASHFFMQKMWLVDLQKGSGRSKITVYIRNRQGGKQDEKKEDN